MFRQPVSEAATPADAQPGAKPDRHSRYRHRGREPQKKSMRLQKANERNESFTLGILSDDDYCNQGGMNNGNNAAVF